MKINKKVLIGTSIVTLSGVLALTKINSNKEQSNLDELEVVNTDVSEYESSDISDIYAGASENSYIKRTSVSLYEDDDSSAVDGSIEDVLKVSYANHEEKGESICFNIFNLNEQARKEINLAITSSGGTDDDVIYIINTLDNEVSRIKSMLSKDKGYAVSGIEYAIEDLIKRKGYSVSANFSVGGRDIGALEIGLNINNIANTKNASYLLESGLSFETLWYGYELYDIDNRFEITHHVDTNEFYISVIDKNITNEALNKQLQLIASQFEGSTDKLLKTFKNLQIELKGYDNFEWDDTGCYDILTDFEIGDCVVSAYAEDEDYMGEPGVHIKISKK